MQNTEEINEKYAVDANLFRQGSTNPKKKSSPWIYMIDAECAETNEKSIFQFLFFESWSFL